MSKKRRSGREFHSSKGNTDTAVGSSAEVSSLCGHKKRISQLTHKDISEDERRETDDSIIEEEFDSRTEKQLDLSVSIDLTLQAEDEQRLDESEPFGAENLRTPVKTNSRYGIDTPLTTGSSTLLGSVFNSPLKGKDVRVFQNFMELENSVAPLDGTKQSCKVSNVNIIDLASEELTYKGCQRSQKAIHNCNRCDGVAVQHIETNIPRCQFVFQDNIGEMMTFSLFKSHIDKIFHGDLAAIESRYLLFCLDVKAAEKTHDIIITQHYYKKEDQYQSNTQEQNDRFYNFVDFVFPQKVVSSHTEEDVQAIMSNGNLTRDEAIRKIHIRNKNRRANPLNSSREE